jgi:hypothetical protein
VSDPYDPINAAFRALNAQNQLAAKDARIKQLEQRLEGLREAGDALWYCYRHANRITPADIEEAVEEWREARNNI